MQIGIPHPGEGQTFDQSATTIPVTVHISHQFQLDRVELWLKNSDSSNSNTLMGTQWVTSNNAQSPFTAEFSTSANSSSYVNGVNRIFAKAYFYAGPGYYPECLSSIRTFNLIKQPASNKALMVFIEPNSATVAVNQTIQLAAKAYDYENGNHTPVPSGTTYQWATTAGSIKPVNERADFSSSVAGSATVSVTVATPDGRRASKQLTITTYAGSASPTYTQQPTINPEVKSCIIKLIGEGRYLDISSNSSMPTPEENEKFKTCFEARKLAVPSQFIPDSPDLNPELERCLKKVVGAQRFYEINSGKSRPTADEERTGREQCFLKIKSTIPAHFAPIAPEKAKLQALPKQPDKIKINAPTSKKIQTSDGTEKEAIEISGKINLSKKEEKSIFIYIFSNPIVLAAKTDDKGNFVYTLEDPLEPGTHEAYVALEEKPNEFVTADPILIDVAQAAPSDGNATGRSLILDSSAPSEQSRAYIFGSLALVMAALICFLVLIRYRRQIKLTTTQ